MKLTKIFVKSRNAMNENDYETWIESQVSRTLNIFENGSDTRATALIVKIMKFFMLENHPNDSRVKIDSSGNCQTLSSRMGTGGGNTPMLLEQENDMSKTIVRRLTPLECERLQGYPDGWTDIGEWTDSKGKKHKEADSPRYKALGNSIALPQWFWLVQKMKKHLPENATLGSLFDGIGGFPLVWEETYGKGTAKWASEIEEFPIAVTKLRFPEESEEDEK